MIVKFNLKKYTAPEQQRADCVMVAIYENGRLSASAKKLDNASKKHISKLLKSFDLKALANKCLVLNEVPQIQAKRVLLINCCKEKKTTATDYQKIIQSSLAALANSGVSSIACYLAEVAVIDHGNEWKLTQTTLAFAKALYRFDQCKSMPSEQTHHVKTVTFIAPEDGDFKACEKAVVNAQAIAAGINLTRDLANLPANICTPSYLAHQAKLLAKKHSALNTKVLSKNDMEKLGMGSLLSVARGSEEPAKLIILKYQGSTSKARPIALVGKGVTFDTGGISIKPSAAMDEMKFDMCGGASVLGTLEAVANLQLPINVVGVIPATENMPSGCATKPGDIVTSLSGQTIEILNTDAEGRLILCDALTYCERFNPRAVIDIATLTGACIIALGNHASGLLSNDETLSQALLNAGKSIGDRAWQLPIWEEYQSQLKSPFADMANIGGREAGTITAACFLARFTKQYCWAHLDIAGTAWESGENKGATGRPVGLLTQYLINECG